MKNFQKGIKKLHKYILITPHFLNSKFIKFLKINRKKYHISVTGLLIFFPKKCCEISFFSDDVSKNFHKTLASLKKQRENNIKKFNYYFVDEEKI